MLYRKIFISVSKFNFDETWEAYMIRSFCSQWRNKSCIIFHCEPQNRSFLFDAQHDYVWIPIRTRAWWLFFSFVDQMSSTDSIWCSYVVLQWSWDKQTIIRLPMFQTLFGLIALRLASRLTSTIHTVFDKFLCHQYHCISWTYCYLNKFPAVNIVPTWHWVLVQISKQTLWLLYLNIEGNYWPNKASKFL